MHTTTENLEATSDVDIPPRIWADMLSAAAQLANAQFPTAMVSLLVTGDAAIRTLNHTWRGVDAPTDILSWPADAEPGQAGELALSWDAVRRQALANGNTEHDEALALIAHGLLHLAGYDHQTAEADTEMDRLTRRLLKTVNIEVTDFGH